MVQIRKLLTKIEDAVPLINLAITTSGASLSTTLPATISPSRLLQASTFVTAGDTNYSMSSSSFVQIGPTFTLSMYMLFLAHARPEREEDIRQSTWKEVIHKARLKLVRVPLNSLYELPSEMPTSLPEATDHGHTAGSSVSEESRQLRIEAEGKEFEFAYQLVIIEDLDDNRVHTYEEGQGEPGPYDDVHLAGIREAVPIHEISKIFYADTGKILNIGSEEEVNSPVLLLKRDLNAIPPRRMMEGFVEDDFEDNKDSHTMQDLLNDVEDDSSQAAIDAQFEREHCAPSSIVLTQSPETPPGPLPWRLPPDLDPEWLAFEVFTDDPDSDTDSIVDGVGTIPLGPSRTPSIDPRMTSALSNLNLEDSKTPDSKDTQPLVPQSHTEETRTKIIGGSTPPIRTSLSLLETILRLLSLQQFQQTSHLSIPDELLNFFLSESATTGAAHGDEQERRRLRAAAKQRVGFDPYDESPIKRRGEEYQYRGGQSQAGWDENRNGEHGEYADSPRERSYSGYESPRYDEGYDSHRIYSPTQSAAYAKVSTPHTPPLLLKDRAYSSRANTPIRSATQDSRATSNAGYVRYASPGTPSAGSGLPAGGRTTHMRFEKQTKGQVKKASPLAKSEPGLANEGFDSSPVSIQVEGQG